MQPFADINHDVIGELLSFGLRDIPLVIASNSEVKHSISD
jgi:hypothetical protein